MLNTTTKDKSYFNCDFSDVSLVNIVTQACLFSIALDKVPEHIDSKISREKHFTKKTFENDFQFGK